MRRPVKEVKKLSSIFGSAVKVASKKSDSNSSVSPAASEYEALKELISPPSPSLASTCSKSSSGQLVKSSKNLSKKSATSFSPLPPKWCSKTGKESMNSDTIISGNEDSPSQLLKDITNILCADRNLGSLASSQKLETVFSQPSLSNLPQTPVSLRRKELSRERKQKWVFKNTQSRRFERLVLTTAKKLGAEATLEIFSKLRTDTGIKEYNALIKICIEKARESNDDGWLVHARKAFELFISLQEQGFPLEEESYSPLLVYLIDTERVEEFYSFFQFIKDKNTGSSSRLGYYEILLWIRVNNNEKVQELLDSVVNNFEDNSDLAVSYLLALCETNKKNELLQLLEIVDVTKISSVDYLTVIFRSLGRLSLENFAEKSLLAFKKSETRDKEISSFICNYVTGMPNLVVEEVLPKFKDLHEKHEVIPSSESFDKIIAYCCDLHQVHAALDVLDQMCQSGVAPSIESFQPILHAIEQTFDLYLVNPIYSLMRRYDLKPKGETFRSLINLCVKMKNFEGAYSMLRDLEDQKMVPTANMYNAIMAGYFRQGNISGALMVLKQMKNANVRPDSETFTYLIGNSECEEDIIKYCEEMKHIGVCGTKYVTMSLINAYANCGLFEKAKQVVLDEEKSDNSCELKSVLVSALTSHGKTSDALELYEEIRQAGWHLEPKAALCLIENIHFQGKLDKLLLLLGELNNPSNWFDGCGRVVLYCVRHKLLSSARDLLKQLKERDEWGTYYVFDQIFSLVLDTEPPDLETGLHMLKVMKEDLGLCPSRTHLDFLLSTCGSAKDLTSAELIWKEYKKADLSFNVLTFLRKYQVLLASAERGAAEKLLKVIEKDDPHVRAVIRACDETYGMTTSGAGKKKTKQVQGN